MWTKELKETRTREIERDFDPTNINDAKARVLARIQELKWMLERYENKPMLMLKEESAKKQIINTLNQNYHVLQWLSINEIEQ